MQVFLFTVKFVKMKRFYRGMFELKNNFCIFFVSVLKIYYYCDKLYKVDYECWR